MPINMRRSQRRPIPIHVMLYTINSISSEMLRCTTNNVSPQGMFIHTDGISFDQFRKLALIIPPQLDVVTDTHHLDVAVRHQHDNGIGVEISSAGPNAKRLIRALCDAHDLGISIYN